MDQRRSNQEESPAAVSPAKAAGLRGVDLLRLCACVALPIPNFSKKNASRLVGATVTKEGGSER